MELCDEKTCCFIGHRKLLVTNKLKQKLLTTIQHLINDGVTVFCFGSRSQFEIICWETIEQIKTIHPNITTINYTTAHETCYTSSEQAERYSKIASHLSHNKVSFIYFDKEIKSSKSLNANKNAYIIRNQDMIENSDICVFYYDNSYSSLKTNSGTAIAYQYAKQKKKKIINIQELL